MSLFVGSALSGISKFKFLDINYYVTQGRSTSHGRRVNPTLGKPKVVDIPERRVIPVSDLSVIDCRRIIVTMTIQR